jgi:phosphopantothenoylcysteine decarboxylase/phosphopantothenate--cysteine ligase
VRFLVTAGPTREPIDPVRYISNRSSGKMGYAIAEAALDSGHDVILISGPVNLDPPGGVQFVPIVTSDEMYEAVHRYVHECDILVMCAAVADYKSQKISATKIKRKNEPFTIDLIPTRDILASLPHKDRQFVLVGFAAETNDVEENAEKKLRAKNCDIVVANDVSNANSGMESDANEVIIFFRTGERERILRAPKKNVARELEQKISKFARKMFDKKNVAVTERN